MNTTRSIEDQLFDVISDGTVRGLVQTLAREALTNMNPEQIISFIEKKLIPEEIESAFQAPGNRQNPAVLHDSRIKHLIDIVQVAFYRKHGVDPTAEPYDVEPPRGAALLAIERAGQEFAVWLSWLYSRLQGKDSKAEKFGQSRTRLIGVLAHGWANHKDGGDKTEFGLLCAIYNEGHKNLVIEAMKERINALFTAEDAALWLMEPAVPQEIAYMLATARTRLGGVELARRDVRNERLLAEIFEPLDLMTEGETKMLMVAQKRVADQVIFARHLSMYVRQYWYRPFTEDVRCELTETDLVTLSVDLIEECGEANTKFPALTASLAETVRSFREKYPQTVNVYIRLSHPTRGNESGMI